MRSYIKVKQAEKLTKTIPELRQLSDNYWKTEILSYILQYYKATNNETIQELIKTEHKKPKAKVETAIKKHIKKWFRDNQDFGSDNFGFILNDEVGNEGTKEGYYDFKIEHSYWKSYFPFECKNLGTSTLLNEYVFVDTKAKTDGGMHRYFIDKYAVNQKFGGMIGLVIYKTEKSIIEQLINKIESVYTNKDTCKLCGTKIVRNSVFDNQNSFDSNHQRAKDEIVIHHIIMDFVNDYVER